MKKPLTPKQWLFVQEYLVDLNATAAAKRAGYSKKTAEVQGCRLLRNAQVKEAVRIGRERREKAAIMTREEILEELSIIGRFDAKKYQVIEEGGGVRVKTFEEMEPGASRALKAIEENRIIRESADGKESLLIHDKIKIEGYDKMKALELLGRHEGLFPTKVDIPGLPEVGQALYELSDKFLPTARGKKARTRSDG